jgi:hypothetical protein
MLPSPIHTEALVVALGVLGRMAEDLWDRLHGSCDMWDTLSMAACHVADQLKANAARDCTTTPEPQQELDI